MSIIRNSLPAVVLFLVGSLLAWYLVPIELEQMRWEVPGMPSTYPIEQLCRPIFLGLLCYLPFIGAVFYAGMGTMVKFEKSFYTYDPLLYIESFPAYETRSYIKRVMSNLWLYRARLGQPLTSMEELTAW